MLDSETFHGTGLKHIWVVITGSQHTVGLRSLSLDVFWFVYGNKLSKPCFQLAVSTGLRQQTSTRPRLVSTGSWCWQPLGGSSPGSQTAATSNWGFHKRCLHNSYLERGVKTTCPWVTGIIGQVAFYRALQTGGHRQDRQKTICKHYTLQHISQLIILLPFNNQMCMVSLISNEKKECGINTRSP